MQVELVNNKEILKPRGGGGTGDSPQLKNHQRNAIEMALKWSFAGGPIVALSEYWYGPPLL